MATNIQTGNEHGPDVMRLLLNASAALDNVRYLIRQRDEFDDAQRSAETQMWLALGALRDLESLIGDDDGKTMIATELTLCHEPNADDDRRTCRRELGHDGEHVDSFQIYERERHARWQAGTIYDFERAEADVYLNA